MKIAGLLAEGYSREIIHSLEQEKKKPYEVLIKLKTREGKIIYFWRPGSEAGIEYEKNLEKKAS